MAQLTPAEFQAALKELRDQYIPMLQAEDKDHMTRRAEINDQWKADRIALGGNPGPSPDVLPKGATFNPGPNQ